MSWIRQVLHLAWKDIRFARWVIAAHVLIALAATATVTIGWTLVAGWLWRPAVIVSGMLLAATFVQADSPSRTDQLWTHQPLRPSAVFVAKASLVLFLIPLAPLLGQLAALLVYGAVPGEIPTLLGLSVLYYGAWLGIAAVVAALTPDLRTFAVGSLVVAVAVTVVPAMASSFGQGGPWAKAFVLGGMIVALGYVYAVRRRGPGVALAAAVLAVGAAAPAVVPGSAPDGRIESETDLPRDIERPELAVRAALPRAGNLELWLEGRAPDGAYRWQLVDAVGVLHLPDGDTARLPWEWSRAQDLGPMADPSAWTGADTLEWLVSPDGPDGIGTIIRTPLSNTQGEAIVEGGATVTLEGRVRALEPRLVATLPAELGGTVTFRSGHLEIVDVLETPAGPSFRLKLTEVFRSGILPPDFGTASMAFALVNAQRGEGLGYNLGGATFGSGSPPLLMPGVSAREVSTGLQPTQLSGRPSTDVAAVSGQWLDQAEFHVFQWVPIGSYPVEIQQVADEGRR